MAGEVFELTRDTVSVWSRRWTRNPLGSARRDSNPFGVVVGTLILFRHRWSSGYDVSLTR